MFSIRVSRSDLVKLYQYREKGGTHEYDEQRSSCPRPVKLSLNVQTTKYFQFLFRTIEIKLQKFDLDQ